jgi:superfamily II DNA or RNA helicase
MKLTNYVNSEDFSLYINFARKVGFYDNNAKAWNISITKLQLYSKADICADYNYIKYLPLNEEVREFFDEYCKELETAVAVTNDLAVDGNYVVIPSRSPLYGRFEFLKPHFIMKYKTFDHVSGRYVQNEVPLYTVKPGQILLFRGLFSILKDLAKRFGIKANVSNPFIEDVSRVSVPTSVGGKDLRVYQLDAVKKAMDSIAEIRGALIQMPTGSGKTLVGEALIKVLTDIGKLKTAFIIVESQDLLNQWAEELSKVFGREKIGKLYQNEQSVKEGGINVVTYQSLYKVVKTYLANVRHSLDVNENRLFTVYKEADFVLVDEAHHLPADSISAILTVNSKAVRVGLSATPFREDNRDLLLHSLTSVPVVRYKMTDEIFRKLNVLVPVKVVNVLVDFLDWQGDYVDDDNVSASRVVKMSSRIISEEGVQKLALYIALKIHEKYKLPVIIHSPYARPLREMSDRFGIPLLEGQKTDAEREVLLQKLRDNEVNVVLATTLMDEGIDIPPLVGLVMMLPGASRVKLVQRMGRLTRPYKGKDTAFAYLFDYSQSKLGALSDIFARQKKKRDDFMRKEGYEVVDVRWKDLKL